MYFPTIDVAIQTNSQENSQEDYCMPQGIVEIVVQTDFEGNTPTDCCTSQEAVQVAIQTDLVITQDDETQIE